MFKSWADPALETEIKRTGTKVFWSHAQSGDPRLRIPNCLSIQTFIFQVDAVAACYTPIPRDIFN